MPRRNAASSIAKAEEKRGQIRLERRPLYQRALRNDKEQKLKELWVCEEFSTTTPRQSKICLKGYDCKDDFQAHLIEAHGISDDRAIAVVQECQYTGENRNLWICGEFSVTTQGKTKISGTCSRGYVAKYHMKNHLKSFHHISNDETISVMVEKGYYTKARPVYGKGKFETLKDGTRHLLKHDVPQCAAKKKPIHENNNSQRQQRTAVTVSLLNPAAQCLSGNKTEIEAHTRDKIQKLLVWYKSLSIPPPGLANIEGTAAAIQFFEILKACNLRGFDSIRQELNLREPTLISKYSVRIIKIAVQSELRRQDKRKLLKWYDSLPVPHIEIFGIREIAALTQVCEIIQNCQWRSIDAVYRDMKFRLNYSIQNINIGIKSAKLLRVDNQEVQIAYSTEEDSAYMEDEDDDTDMEDATFEDDAESISAEDEDSDADTGDTTKLTSRSVRKNPITY